MLRGKLQSAKGSVIFPMFRLVWVGGGDVEMNKVQEMLSEEERDFGVILCLCDTLVGANVDTGLHM